MLRATVILVFFAAMPLMGIAQNPEYPHGDGWNEAGPESSSVLFGPASFFGSNRDHDTPSERIAYQTQPSGGGSAGAGSSGAGSSGSGGVYATDPSAILTQLQLQNIFTPSTYDASGYSNTFVIQPVLPFPEMKSGPLLGPLIGG